MVNTSNLDLDLDRLQDTEPATRVCVVEACSYTKGVGAPTITEDCKTFREFEREVDRLKVELDAVLAEAKARMGAPTRRRADSLEQNSKETGRGSSVADTGETDPPPLGSGLCVRDLMTRNVKTLAPNDKISVVSELMKVGNFRHVVVVEDSGAIAGVVSHRDIVFTALDWRMPIGRPASTWCTPRASAYSRTPS